MKRWKTMYAVYAVVCMILPKVIRIVIFLPVFHLKNFPRIGSVLYAVPVKMSFLLNEGRE